MRYKDKKTGYIWYFKGITADDVELHNKHEDRTIHTPRSTFKKFFAQVPDRDRNGFLVNASTKVWN